MGVSSWPCRGPKRHGSEHFEALSPRGQPAMELARGDDVWVRVAGLNAPGAENRAERIYGHGWRSAILKCKFLCRYRQGGVQVKMSSGEAVTVREEYLVPADVWEAFVPGDGPEDRLAAQHACNLPEVLQRSGPLQ